MYIIQANLSRDALRALQRRDVIICPRCEAVYWTDLALPITGESALRIQFRCNHCRADFGLHKCPPPSAN